MPASSQPDSGRLEHRHDRGVLGALAARRTAARIGTARAVLLGKTGLAPFGLLLPLAGRGPGLALFLLGSIAVIGGIVAGNVIWTGWVQAYYPAGLLGRISTSVQVFNYGAIAAGAILAGLAASHVGVRPTLWIMLTGLVLSSLVLMLGPLRKLSDLPSHQAPDATAQTSPEQKPNTHGHQPPATISRAASTCHERPRRPPPDDA
jgi:MFS family permease